MDNDHHPVDHLFALHDKFGSYPKGVAPIKERIKGTAFFPGGYGLWNTQLNKPLPPMPTGGIMIVGHNFDSEAGFKRALENGGENLNGPTWKNLLMFLKKVEIFPEQCFFTNAYVGLQLGNHAMGPFPGRQYPEFVDWCQKFLLEQIKLMQPRLILSLGANVPSFLALLSPELRPVWSGVEHLTLLDKQNAALVYPSNFVGLLQPAAVVALTHPAYRPLNVKRRLYGDITGDMAEQALVKDAMENSRA